jgi:hypothetical protein
VKENLQLLRSLYPLLFHLIIMIIDYGVSYKGDRQSHKGDDDVMPESMEQAYAAIIGKQEEIIADIRAYKESQKDEFKKIYEKVLDLNLNHNNKLIPEFQKAEEAKNNSWSFGKVIKTILSVLMFVSLFGAFFN